MKISVFGASGAIGQHFVKKALEAGYKLNVYVRNRGKYPISHENQTIIEGELNDFIKIQSFIEDSDVVVSTLGSSMAKDAAGYPILTGHINIMKPKYYQNKHRYY